MPHQKFSFYSGGCLPCPNPIRSTSSIQGRNHSQFTPPKNMIRKKGPDILNTTKPKSKKDQNQVVMENKQVADLKKMVKKASSIRRISEMDDLDVHLGPHFVQNQLSSTRSKSSSSSTTTTTTSSYPNYMKPTASSDARKDRLQEKVSEKEKPQRKIIVSSSISSPSPPPCNTRKSSMELAGPLTKKNKEATTLFGKINAGRATCSSTIKDSRFPKELELSPGGTDSEGTSAFKVCPYTYCSLNGHRHDPLPPLKSYMSTRRKLFKTQKSKRGLEKGEKCEETSACIAVSPLNDEVNDDFFVEIHAELSGSSSGLVFNGSDDTNLPDGNFGHDGCSPETSFEEKEVGSWKDYSDDHSDSSTVNEPSGTRYLERDCDEVILSYLKDVLEEKQIQKGGKDDANLKDLNYYINSEISVKENLVRDDHFDNGIDYILQSKLVEADDAEHELEDEVTHSYLDNCLIESDTTELLEEEQIQEEDHKLEDEVALSYLNNCSSEEDISEILEEKEIQEECTYDTTTLQNLHYNGDDISAKEDVVQNDHVGSDIDHIPLNEQHPDGAEHKLEVEVTLSYLSNCLSENDSEILEEKQIQEEGNRDISIKENIVENDHVCNDILDHILQSKHLDDAENKLEDEVAFSYEHICLSENDVNEIRDEKQIQEVGDRDTSVKEDLINNDTDHIPQNDFFHPGDAEHKLEDNVILSYFSENDVSEILEEKQIQEEGNRNTSDKEDLINNDHVNNDIDHILQSELIHPDIAEHELEDEVTLNYLDNCLIENNVRDIQEDGIHDATLRDLEHYNCDITVNEDLVEDDHVGNDIYGILQNEFVQPDDAETSPPETDLEKENSEFKRLEGIKDDTNDESEYTNLTFDKEAEKESSDLNNIDETTDDKNHELECTRQIVDMAFSDKRSDSNGLEAIQDWDEEKEVDVLKGSTCLSEIMAQEEDISVEDDAEPESSENEDGLLHRGIQPEIGGSNFNKDKENEINEELQENGSGVTNKSQEDYMSEDLASIFDQILVSESEIDLRRRYHYTRKMSKDEQEELRTFNPRGPNFLPVEPDPEAERVDLKHQILDDKKNSEEWMIDYALQRTVSRLRRVRKRKVAVLVEAFETVSPTRMFESSQHNSHDSQVFAQVRTVQACS